MMPVRVHKSVYVDPDLNQCPSLNALGLHVQPNLQKSSRHTGRKFLRMGAGCWHAARCMHDLM